MLTTRRGQRDTVDPDRGRSARARRPYASLVVLVAAACSGCTISDSLLPPNPIPEVRPTDASALNQNPMPVSTATNEPDQQSQPMLAPQPVGGPVAESALPPPAAPPPVRTAPPPNENGRAAAFPAAGRQHDASPSRLALPPAAATAEPPVPARTEASRQPQRREVPRGAVATIRFTPVIGAPVSAIRPLSEELETSARRDGVTIRNTADKPVDNILRGYFSATTSGRETDVVYVWNVLDAQGDMKHRIQGTEKVRGRSGKDWSAVSDSVMRKIARKTIADYVQWHAAAGG